MQPTRAERSAAEASDFRRSLYRPRRLTGYCDRQRREHHPTISFRLYGGCIRSGSATNLAAAVHLSQDSATRPARTSHSDRTAGRRRVLREGRVDAAGPRGTLAADDDCASGRSRPFAAPESPALARGRGV